jgi:hypothetical protein
VQEQADTYPPAAAQTLIRECITSYATLLASEHSATPPDEIIARATQAAAAVLGAPLAKRVLLFFALLLVPGGPADHTAGLLSLLHYDGKVRRLLTPLRILQCSNACNVSAITMRLELCLCNGPAGCG